ncbi:hypothetical protein G7Y79_00050g086110 [Physcia stellaris]|nr:hypothetical protein G7Y79_00050g086110 [Physcia stellaris]
MAQKLSAAELYSARSREQISRNSIRREYQDHLERVKKGKKRMQKIEKDIGHIELLVEYGRLMNRVEFDEDEIEEKECDIKILDEKIAKLTILIEEEKVARIAAESAEAQQGYTPDYPPRSRGRPPGGDRDSAGHGSRNASPQLAYDPKEQARSSEQAPLRNRERTGHNTRKARVSTAHAKKERI